MQKIANYYLTLSPPDALGRSQILDYSSERPASSDQVCAVLVRPACHYDPHQYVGQFVLLGAKKTLCDAGFCLIPLAELDAYGSYAELYEAIGALPIYAPLQEEARYRSDGWFFRFVDGSCIYQRAEDGALFSLDFLLSEDPSHCEELIQAFEGFEERA
jgi:hypothetical protein